MRRLMRILALLVAIALSLWTTTIDVAAAADSQPTPMSPAPGTRVTANPVLRWTRAAGAASYEWEISRDQAFTQLIQPKATTANISGTPWKDVPVGTVYWRVRAKIGTTFTGWSTTSFIRDIAPGPTSLSPIDGRTFVYPNDALLFSWEALASVASYEFQYDDDPNFAQPTLINTNFPSYALAAPVPLNTPFFWRVRGKSADNIATEWSETRDFRLTWPAVPQLISPVSTNNPPIEELVFNWQPVAGAATYDIEIARNQDWVNNIRHRAQTIRGTTYALPRTLEAGAYFWRVRARSSDRTTLGMVGDWSEVRTFTRRWPADDTQPNSRVELVQPLDAGTPVAVPEMTYRFTPARLAATYGIEVSTTSDFISPQRCRTDHTTLTPYTVINGGGAGGCDNLDMSPGTTYYWRVVPLDTPGDANADASPPAWSGTIQGENSSQGGLPQVESFVVDLPQPTVTGPADGATVPAPILTWAAPNGFTNFFVSVFAADGTTVATATVNGTAFVPKDLDPADGPFRWWVVTVDSRNRRSPVPISAERSFSLAPQAAVNAAPQLLQPADGTISTTPPLMSWTPALNAQSYDVYVSNNGGYSVTLLSSGITTTAYAHPNQTAALGEGNWQWFVRARLAGGTTLNSANGTFRIAAPTSGITNYRSPAHCPPTTSCAATVTTPTLDWDDLPNVQSYIVYIANDANFTSIQKTVWTQWSTLTLTDDLPDNVAGQAYYWFVRPCYGKNNTLCATFDATTYPTARAFQKRSVPVNVLSPADGVVIEDEVTFRWEDYLKTVRSNFSASQQLTQRYDLEAKQYVVQVATAADFATTTIVHDSAPQDATTYNVPDEALPVDADLYWRVQAIDDTGNKLAWSTPRRLTKRVQPPTAIGPTNNETVTGNVAFRWNAQSSALGYQIEVYARPDQPLSPGNLKFKVNGGSLVNANSVSPTKNSELPEAGAYGWRIRRVQPDNTYGAWSTETNAGLHLFTYAGPDPELLQPSSGAVVDPDDILLTWRPAPRAAKYRVEISTSSNMIPAYETKDTVMPYWAPEKTLAKGTWFWRISSLDASGTVIGKSEIRRFVVGNRSTFGEYFGVTPFRLMDTRLSGGVVPQGGTRLLKVTGAGPVPASGVSAVILNVTVTEPTRDSYITVYPANEPQPFASHLNVRPGQTVPNLVTVKVSPQGEVLFFNAQGTTHLIADVVGYYGDGSQPRGDRFVPAPTPTRIYNSMDDPRGPVARLGSRDVRINGLAGVPDNATGVMLNATVVSFEIGYLTLYPKNNDLPPTASNLNFTAGQTVPNQVAVRIGLDKSITLFAAGKTHVILDVVGWFVAGDPAAGSVFISRSPCRVFDSRVAGTTKLNANEDRRIKVSGSGSACGVPSSAKGIVANVTVADPEAAGFVTVYPGGTRPWASNLNYVRGDTAVPNHVVVGTAADGTIVLYTVSKAHLIVDIVGWYED